MQCDIDKRIIVQIYIEVEFYVGFANHKDSSEPLLSITIKNNQDKEIKVWGVHHYDNYREDVIYVQCVDELDLVDRFIFFPPKFFCMRLQR